MKNKSKISISRLLFIIVIIACSFFLYNTKIRSRSESLEKISKFESNLNIEKNKDKSTVDLSELDLNMVGVLYVPKIDLTIPIYDSTDEEALSKGVGIIEGTGTLQPKLGGNTILTSHNGDSSRDLFINLNKLKENDEFYTKDTKNKIRKYKVDNIQTVLPVDEDKHWIKDSNPRITLRTCTPVGINSHRLLVSGYEVEYDGSGIPSGKLTFSSFEIGIIAIGGLSLLLLLLSFKRDKNEVEDDDFDWDEYF